jgi:formylmethanofuran dehydrogenase subunit E-like metal-binding protein
VPKKKKNKEGKGIDKILKAGENYQNSGNAGHFRVEDKQVLEDGTVLIKYSWDKTFGEYYKQQTGKKRITYKGMHLFITKFLADRANNGLEEGTSCRELQALRKRKFYKVYK